MRRLAFDKNEVPPRYVQRGDEVAASGGVLNRRCNFSAGPGAGEAVITLAAACVLGGLAEPKAAANLS